MQRISLVKTAHQYLSEHLKPGAIAIDATVGNGHDTLFLVQQVGVTGKVYGFDIQAEAIGATQEKFQQTGLPNECLVLHQTSHALMDENISPQHHGQISAITFNLGYLPGGDKSIITETDATLKAITLGCGLLAAGGIMTIMVYPGHSGGDEEALQVERWCEDLPAEQFKVETIYNAEIKLTAPRLFVVFKGFGG
ncbi:MAG: class I SAM-dependent methyltransferase [Methylococcaceae bacterium]